MIYSFSQRFNAPIYQLPANRNVKMIPGLSIPAIRILSTINLQSLLERVELFISCGGGRSSENQLSVQLPLLRNVPCSSNFLVDKWVIMLEVCAKTFEFEGSPDRESVLC